MTPLILALPVGSLLPASVLLTQSSERRKRDREGLLGLRVRGLGLRGREGQKMDSQRIFCTLRRHNGSCRAQKKKKKILFKVVQINLVNRLIFKY